MAEDSSSSQQIVPTQNQQNASITTLPNVAHQLPIKLNSTNYLLWQAQIMPLLYSYDLASHIDGSEEPPSKLLNNQPNPIFHS